ncbi:MAG: hypothetical protein SLAVMIC_00927 [uncultured marine phage]|uniref:Uncharacterized protein n=1 Tax=uncultured marine phage TaxID=707152 RepID=A0A8D9FRI1_9VIRU|nr:MAG: hypothetical protein SLAVMIC_00927 [uncultured marine phage]
MDHKIIERNGIFIVYVRDNYFSLSKLRKVDKWRVMYKGLHSPAHFETLEEARNWIQVRLKPDVEHSIYQEEK